MSTFVIGDVHGCHRTLRALLGKLPFEPARDRLWLVGDLVNRGSGSLEVLRWAREQSELMGERFVCVLGNHDLHLLALDAGVRDRPSPDLLPILEASDRQQLIGWLKERPLLHHEKVASQHVVMVHAGLWPSWTVKKAVIWSERLTDALRHPKYERRLLSSPKSLRAAEGNLRRLADALFAFTSLRTLQVGKAHSPCAHKGVVAEIPEGCVPWFEAPNSQWHGAKILFGHWAALGLFQGHGVVGLDSGCAWGGRLTALRMEDGQVFQVERAPGDAS